ncbi:hypothetical protein BpHYR1_005955 [Brachionus plicatilis]|uniref:Uncharacterized protein n=1 Tax=Brachionus plicatilis TaxID=10195 RepID=A0A3M7PCI4_BRAPC|nr:hypothetical protein BpHYR1_005955 [Brachionus plicatilis]
MDCLVSDLDIWHECLAEISRCLHEKINELLVSDWHNVKLFHGLKMLKRILNSVKCEGTSSALLTHARRKISSRAPTMPPGYTPSIRIRLTQPLTLPKSKQYAGFG